MTAEEHKFANGDCFDLDGKSVLVTGGTGSFGQRFVRTVLQRYKPRRVIVFSRDELKQYEMGLGLSLSDYPAIRYFIGDVRDGERSEAHTSELQSLLRTSYAVFCLKKKNTTPR